MTTASKIEHIKQIQSGKAKGDAQKIYNLISHSQRGISIKYICHAIGLSHQTATARLSELCDLGVVFISHTEDELSYFKVENIEDHIKLNSFNRHQDKVKKWIKKGEKLGVKFQINI